MLDFASYYKQSEFGKNAIDKALPEDQGAPFDVLVKETRQSYSSPKFKIEVNDEERKTSETMDLLKKRKFIYSHLYQLDETFVDEVYRKMLSFFEDILIEESEEDIMQGNVMTHDELKHEIKGWRHLK